MLKNKIIILTGALGGLGQYAVRKCLDEGAIVVGVDSGRAMTPEFQRSEFWKTVSAKTSWRFKGANLMDEQEVTSLVSATCTEFGRIDGLINLVGGIYPWSDVTQVETKTWDFTLELNLKTAFLCSREVMKIMMAQRSGSIVNVGAQAALRGGAMAGPYGVAKAGVLNLTETMADEGKSNNIRVNAIVPSIIDTPANRKSMPEADFSKWVTPFEISEVLAFLASDRSTGINGSIIRVPGRV